MRKEILLAVVSAFSLLLATSLLLPKSEITAAFIISSSQNKIIGEITGGGNVNLISSSYVSKIAIGQPVVGTATSGNFKICFGILCTGIFQPLYSMNFSGSLNYSDRSPVTFADLIVTIENSTLKRTTQSSTDANGHFLVIFDDLTENYINRDLFVTFLVKGKIEATYTCWYNHSQQLGKNCCPTTPPTVPTCPP
jgi:hypothetical protein